MALNENVVRAQDERISKLVRTPAFLAVAGSLTGLAAATSVENGIGIGLVSAVSIIAMALIARPLRSITGVFARIPVLLIVSATIVTLVSFVARVIDPVVTQNLGIYLPLASLNGIVACFIFDDGFTGGPLDGSPVATAVFSAVCAFASLAFVGFINGMLSTGAVFGLTMNELAASPFAIFGTPAGSLLVLALVATFINSVVDAARKSRELAEAPADTEGSER